VALLRGEGARNHQLTVERHVQPGGATFERNRFAGLISTAGGGDFVVRDPEDRQRALKKIFERLGRQ
jgi:hypothetical protein